MSKSDYEYSNAKECFEVVVNGVNMFSMCMSMDEQFKTIWNAAIDYAIENHPSDLKDLKI